MYACNNPRWIIDLNFLPSFYSSLLSSPKCLCVAEEWYFLVLSICFLSFKVTCCLQRVNTLLASRGFVSGMNFSISDILVRCTTPHLLSQVAQTYCASWESGTRNWIWSFVLNEPWPKFIHLSYVSSILSGLILVLKSSQVKSSQFLFKLTQNNYNLYKLVL